MNYKRITHGNETRCSNCDDAWYCQKECINNKYVKQLITLENMIDSGELTDVVRCDKCKYLKIINDGKIYAICTQTGFEFLPFGTDTRKHFCAFGKTTMEETSQTDSKSLFDACM